MTLFAELSGHRVVSGRIVIPYVGAWHADVTLDKEVSLATSGLALVLGDLTMRCAPWRAVVAYQGGTDVRLIGGNAGWRKVIKEDGYTNPAGVRLSYVLGACARECGETIEIATDRVLGTHYARERAPGTRHLNTLAPSSWRIDADGVTRIGPRAARLITSAFTVVGFSGARGAMQIATEALADIVPGRSLKGTTMSGPITIGGVTHMIDGGKVRTQVLAS